MNKSTGKISKHMVFLGLAILATTAVQLDAKAADAGKRNVEVSADKKLSGSRNNSGRKIAVAGDIAAISSTSGDMDQISAQAAINDTRSKLSQRLKDLNINFKVPEVKIPKNLETTCDTCLTEGKRAAVFAHEHTLQFTTWAGRYIMQFIEPPKVTPVSSPYLMDNKLVPSLGARSSRLYLTQEGRLKTTVSR